MSTSADVGSFIESKTSVVQTSNVGFTSEVPDYLVVHTGPDVYSPNLYLQAPPSQPRYDGVCVCGQEYTVSEATVSGSVLPARLPRKRNQVTPVRKLLL